MPTKTQSVQVKRGSSFSGSIDGVPFVANEGDIYASDDPVVKEYPHFFGPIDPQRSRPEVEDMTAEPGLKRGQ